MIVINSSVLRSRDKQEAKKKVMAEFIEEERRRDEALAKQVQRAQSLSVFIT